MAKGTFTGLETYEYITKPQFSTVGFYYRPNWEPVDEFALLVPHLSSVTKRQERCATYYLVKLSSGEEYGFRVLYSDEGDIGEEFDVKTIKKFLKKDNLSTRRR